jgi:ribose transport system substrate-binding protein
VRRPILTLALAVAAVGCGRGSDTGGAGKRPLLGVTLLTQTHDFYKELERGLREEAERRGLDVVVTSCEMDPAKQASQIDDFVAQKVAAILAAPCDSAAIGANLAAPEQAGIPVFTADIAAAGGRIVSHVASDNVQGGRLAGEALARFLGGSGKVLVIDHPTVASVQDRVKGFEEELAKHPGIQIVGRPSSDGQRAKAMAVMEDMLQAHPDLRGVFGINDDSALGAAAVLEAAGRKDVVVVGYDATPEARNAIRSGGPLKADVVQDPRKIGRTAVEMVARHLGGESVPPLISVEVGLVDQETLARQ